MSDSYARAPYGREDRSEDDGGGRRKRRRDLTPLSTYYGLPAVKSSHYGWLIITYFFVGGLAGAAQVIAAIADLVGRQPDRAVVRAGRYVALAGALISPVLLVADLHTPDRFYNMLRIFRRTSPMSFGAWTLFAFGATSGLTAFGQALHDLFGLALGRSLARVFGVPAALAGLVISYYTGILLSATSTPLWASAHKLLPALFGATAVSTGNAAILLLLELAGAPRAARRRLERLALVAGTVQMALALLVERHWKKEGLATVLERPRMKLANRAGALGLGVIVPRAIYGLLLFTGSESRLASFAAALMVLVGGYIERAVILAAGNESAKRPEDYFTLTQEAEEDSALPARRRGAVTPAAAGGHA